MKRGFTLIEVSFVLAVMALLVALIVPAYQTLTLRARSEEAHAMLSAIAHAELRYHRDHGAFVECPPEGEPLRAPTPFPSDRACWKALGIATDAVRFQYGVALKDGSFAVTARADLDGNGVASSYVLDGRTLNLTVERELE